MKTAENGEYPHLRAPPTPAGHDEQLTNPDVERTRWNRRFKVNTGSAQRVPTSPNRLEQNVTATRPDEEWRRAIQAEGDVRIRRGLHPQGPTNS